MVGRPDLPVPQGFFAENERNTVFLPDPAVASDAILIQDGPDIPAELNLILGRLMEERTCKCPRQIAAIASTERAAVFK